MTDCIECGRSLQDREMCGMLAAACKTHGETGHTKPVIAVATDWQLSQPEHYMRLAKELAALGMPRRRVADWIADAVYRYEGDIVWPDGRPFDLYDDIVDHAFGDDGTFRWISYFLKAGKRPPRYMPQRQVLARLRLIDLAMRLTRPRVCSAH